MNVWAIIPVKPSRDSKSRLARILTAGERSELTRYILSRTLEVLGDVPTVKRSLVVSRDSGILKLARQHGALTYDESANQDLNVALTRATHIAAAQKASCALILPADLPFITADDVIAVIEAASPESCGGGNGFLSRKRGLAICSDDEQNGTNALLVCPPTGFNFQYGPGSFQRHLDEATRLGLAHCIVDVPGIQFDLDTEEDYQAYLARQSESLVRS
ncbi:MAG: 2-phospho-L-lactate guanylyltransferase [Chloroflexota bacterium]|nr:MAG: 2-phospho-L-lactate guanylyltransferase [Chloroflexota bacterium]